MRVINDCDSLLKMEKNLSIFTEEFGNRAEYEHLKFKEASDLPKKTKLVIVGAGLAGISIAAKAWHLGFRNEDLIILDENDYFAKQFIERTRNINQKVMRSPYKHHTGPSQDLSLSDFARLNYKKLSRAEKHQLYLDRLGERAIPPLDFFLSHTIHVVIKHSLHTNAYKFKVKEIYKKGDSWIIEDDNNNLIQSKYVILALGSKVSNSNQIPPMTVPLFNSLSTSINDYLSEKNQDICVVGSGNTAAHVILSALLRGKKVNWIIRNEEIYKCTDIPHEYWRDEGLSSFMKLSIPERELKLKEIFHGSAMLEHFYLFRYFKKRGSLKVYEHTVIEKQVALDKIQLSNKEIIHVDAVVLSNGLVPSKLPSIQFDILTKKGLPILIDETLEVAKGSNLYIASTHSILSLGPAAKNIDGARLASERILIDIVNKENKSNILYSNDLNNSINRVRRSFFGTTGAITG
ncbi:FAD-dependent oxidoreductase [Priestia sp. P5]|uniref:FAD-dependent oxidoreductase n=1 Tax=Priestia sp. P5 TaxID=2917806 RepID=UPI0024061C04|nr:FAD-dependent oxidoreductase [Priestia sp. P5]MDG0059145.1 NAD(P)/FAD-dependent oxidoreductase [Priestia sp. P5]